jgi:hypothetical protein
MSEPCRFPHPLAAVDILSPDDSEESVVGTDLHQLKQHQHESPGDCR